MGNEVVFQPSELTSQLHQGEVLSGLLEFTYDPVSKAVAETPHSFCVIASQECDLARDYEARGLGEASNLKSILLLKADSPEVARATINYSNWNKAKTNTAERWHVLEAAPPDLDRAGEGLPILVMDFRQVFSMPPAEVYRQVAEGSAVRRAMLLSPYREHLQSRVMAYLGRVALDREHHV